MEFEHFCSLGTLCHSSLLLKRNKLKKCSYPFDWIYSNGDNILHCIKNGFKIFLDETYYININDNKCGHSYYHEKMFNHHNPLKKEDYNYYVRCVERFKTLLKCNKRKLFVMMYVNMKQDDIKNINKNMIKFNKRFSKHTTNYILLVIYHITNKEKNHYFEYNDNIHILYLYSSSSDGLQFDNEDDNLYLDNIMLKYKFKDIPIELNIFQLIITQIKKQIIKIHYHYQTHFLSPIFQLMNIQRHEIQKS
uniref:Uncharacterized protein n=1 Tax=viral metagenome TaxID=1070528 RepID=A0A6C0EXW3_9ZZZZ